MQLDLFEKDEFVLLKEEVEKLHQSSENVRKGIFARYNELAKMYMSLRQEIDAFKSVGYKKHPTELFEFFNEKVS